MRQRARDAYDLMLKVREASKKKDTEEILALCDKYLAYPRPRPELPRSMNFIREKIIILPSKP